MNPDNLNNPVSAQAPASAHIPPSIPPPIPSTPPPVPLVGTYIPPTIPPIPVAGPSNNAHLFWGLFIIAVVVLFSGLFVGWKYIGSPLDLGIFAPPSTSSPLVAEKLSYAGKKVLYIDSYNEGYDWSDGITQGVKATLEGSGATLQIIRMDTKRNPGEDFKKAAGEKAKAEIESFKPDVLIVSDDNAFKYVVVPYYKDAKLPIVFCGLNWDAGLYGAPYTNTTGMVEVSLTLQIIEHLKEYAHGTRLGYLSADNETERKNLVYYEKLFGLVFSKTYFVKTMAEWKEAFTKLQTESDVLIFENSAGISDWSDADAEAYALAHTKIPVGTTNLWTMKESLLGITKVPDEEGEWAAGAALEILSGVSPSTIPLVKNKRGNLAVNFKIAEVLGVKFSPSILKNAQVIK